MHLQPPWCLERRHEVHRAYSWPQVRTRIERSRRVLESQIGGNERFNGEVLQGSILAIEEDREMLLHYDQELRLPDRLDRSTLKCPGCLALLRPWLQVQPHFRSNCRWAAGPQQLLPPVWGVPIHDPTGLPPRNQPRMIIHIYQIINTMNYDFVVVGAGTMGRSIALYLNLQHPQAKIALV